MGAAALEGLPGDGVVFANPLGSGVASWSESEAAQPLAAHHAHPVAAEEWTQHTDGTDIWYTNSKGESVWELPLTHPRVVARLKEFQRPV